MKRRQNIRASHTDTRAGQRRRVASRRTASSVPGRSTKPSGILIITSHKPVSGQSINVDSSVATRAFIGTNPENAANFYIAVARGISAIVKQPLASAASHSSSAWQGGSPSMPSIPFVTHRAFSF